MASKTGLTEFVKSMNYQGMEAGLKETPALIEYRDDRGRNWLHLAASIDVKKKGISSTNSLQMAQLLLSKGIDVNEPAFREGNWLATPLWFAVARGGNIVLAKYFLERGSSPDHCLWAASYANNKAMLSLLIKNGAPLEAIAENETPLLHAVKFSRFEAAETLLQAGANPDFVDTRGMTALHYMLKKGTDLKYFEPFISRGARGDIPGPDGRTAAQIMSRKRHDGFRDLAGKLATSW